MKEMTKKKKRERTNSSDPQPNRKKHEDNLNAATAEKQVGRVRHAVETATNRLGTTMVLGQGLRLAAKTTLMMSSYMKQ